MSRRVDPCVPPVAGVGMTREQMEKRRLDAGAMLRSGVIPAEVARRFNVSSVTAGRWARKLLAGGIKNLERRKAKGRPFLLKRTLIADLIRQFRQRQTAHSVAMAIRETYGVSYSDEHALRIARKLSPHLYSRKRRTTPNQRTAGPGAASKTTMEND